MNRLNAAHDDDFHAWTPDRAAERRRTGAGWPSRRRGRGSSLACFPTEPSLTLEPSFTLDPALDPAYPADLFPPEWRV